MMEAKEIETAPCVSEELPRHSLEGPPLALSELFFPHGFPVAVETNSEEVLRQYHAMWDCFQERRSVDPIVVHVQVVDTVTSTDCPPAPSYRILLPLMVCAADADNYAIVDLERCTAEIVLTQAALLHPLYVQYFFLGVALCCISTRYTTPIHAGCVSRNGVGVLLCGDSGAGKSTLSYACARAGWTYTSDDASFLLDGDFPPMVAGNCHQVRFRPSASELFEELSGLSITPRAAGKPSIKLSTLPMKEIQRTETARIRHIVYLNRNHTGAPDLLSYPKALARRSMREVLFGLPETRVRQCEAIERLLTLHPYELRYQSLEDAIALLNGLTESGND